MKTNSLEARIERALSPEEKFIRRGDSPESLNGEIRVLESFLWDLLRHCQKQRQATDALFERLSAEAKTLYESIMDAANENDEF